MPDASPSLDWTVLQQRPTYRSVTQPDIPHCGPMVTLRRDMLECDSQVAATPASN
jgi:hypothetical protein